MVRDHSRCKHMVFVEFLEFICRVAHAAQFYEIDEKRLAMNKRLSIHHSDSSDFHEDDMNVNIESSDGSAEDEEDLWNSYRTGHDDDDFF